MSRKNGSKTNAEGFTLIELMVVVAIIGLLMAILLPSLASARANARNTNCLSNLKAQGIMTQFYLNNNKEQFPVRSATSATGGGSLYGAYEPTRIIIKEDRRPLEIFGCPADAWDGRMIEVGVESNPAPATGTPEADRLGIGGYYKLPVDYKIRWSYGLNNMTGVKPTTEAERLVFSPNAAAYKNTTKTLLVADATWNARAHNTSINDAPKLKGRVANANAPFRWDRLADITDEWNRPRESGKRHPGGNNVVFFDQHAETVSQRALFAPATVLYSWSESWDPTGTNVKYPSGVQDPNDPNLPELP